MSLTRWLMFLLGVILVCLTRLIPLSDAVEVVTAEIRSLDPRFALLVPPNAKLERIADGFTWVEGPVWNKEGGFLLFSDIPPMRGRRSSCDPMPITGPWRKKSWNPPNGAAFKAAARRHATVCSAAL